MKATQAGIEHRGLFGLPGNTAVDTVTSDAAAASDHAAERADFEF